MINFDLLISLVDFHQEKKNCIYFCKDKWWSQKEFKCGEISGLRFVNQKGHFVHAQQSWQSINVCKIENNDISSFQTTSEIGHSNILQFYRTEFTSSCGESTSILDKCKFRQNFWYNIGTIIIGSKFTIGVFSEK